MHWPLTADYWPLTDQWPRLCMRRCLWRPTPLPVVSSVHLVQRQCVHEPVDDVEQRKCQRKHSARDSVDLASFLFTFGVDDPRRTSVSAALDDVNLQTRNTIQRKASQRRPINHGRRQNGVLLGILGPQSKFYQRQESGTLNTTGYTLLITCRQPSIWAIFATSLTTLGKWI